MATVSEKVLDAVRQAGVKGMNVEELPEATGASKASITKAINSLEEQDLVRRKDDNLVVPVLRRGRRLVLTQERDVKVEKLVTDAGDDGLSLADVAERIEISKSLAYQSLWRLSKQGKVKRIGVTRTTRWIAA